jgi:hypothetical protein
MVQNFEDFITHARAPIADELTRSELLNCRFDVFANASVPFGQDPNSALKSGG